MSFFPVIVVGQINIADGPFVRLKQMPDLIFVFPGLRQLLRRLDVVSLDDDRGALSGVASYREAKIRHAALHVAMSDNTRCAENQETPGLSSSTAKVRDRYVRFHP